MGKAWRPQWEWQGLCDKARFGEGGETAERRKAESLRNLTEERRDGGDNVCLGNRDICEV